MPRGWLTIGVAAAAAGVERRTYLRRAQALHREHGGILRAFSAPGRPVRKWLVNPRAFERALNGVDREQVVLEGLVRRVERLEKQVLELKRASRVTREHLDELDGLEAQLRELVAAVRQRAA
jgi:hypothetical protein